MRNQNAEIRNETICKHIDKRHIHTHVVINSTSLDCSRKFRNFKGSSFAIRRIADTLCVENGLSIITNPKPSRGSYGKWQGDDKPLSNREKLEHMIDAALQNAKDYDAFAPWKSVISPSIIFLPGISVTIISVFVAAIPSFSNPVNVLITE